MSLEAHNHFLPTLFFLPDSTATLSTLYQAKSCTVKLLSIFVSVINLNRLRNLICARTPLETDAHKHKWMMGVQPHVRAVCATVNRLYCCLYCSCF
ncbi:hypothetical protein XELAEV_18039276mg [Xenopus laevis]|uniref:Uncharacterized protein n=1 Tax=Xenopus laevis TaxID=8355 RepID=A0A974C8M0_XENLA|nr:hypothetical protein XELAEV_18039276mg [Xenopus laevis]